MIKIGSHLSISKGFYHAGKMALDIQASTFQFFTRNPRGGKAKAIDHKDIDKYIALIRNREFGPILAHAPYTLNMCSDNEKTREFARMVLEDDLKRLQYIPCNLYNFHPGSHVGQGAEIGIQRIADTINDILKEEYQMHLLLETMAGKGSEVGKTFEELKEIIDRIQLKDKIGVCMDTCHVYSAGYDIVNDLEGVITEFDKVIGLDRLKAIHLNGSKYPLGSFKDRHEVLGKGTIPMETILNIVGHPMLRHIPFFLETPNEVEGYKREIQIINKELKKK
ncbi:MAG: deoxyribonuclease IV [Eubacteriales bacterium]